MALKVIFRKKAERQLDFLIAQGEKMFGSKVAAKFYDKVMSEIPLLAINPLLGPIEPLLEKRARTYRSFYLVAMWDTRREPDWLAASIR